MRRFRLWLDDHPFFHGFFFGLLFFCSLSFIRHLLTVR